MLTDEELARQLYEPVEKKWDGMHLRMAGEMSKQVRHLAAIDNRSLQDQLRHLVAVGVRCEFERLKREEEAAPAIAAEVSRQHREAVRKVLAEARKRDAA